jgi:hypothetical protein
MRKIFRDAFRGRQQGAMLRGVSKGIDRGLQALKTARYLKSDGCDG